MRIRGLWVFAVASAMILMSPLAAAVVIEAPDGTGSTNVPTMGSCTAMVSGGAFPPSTRVDPNGQDDVHFEYYVSWNDDRTSGVSAQHYFLLTVSYSKAVGDQTDSLTKNTPVDADDSDLLEVTVLDVEPGETITVTWTAEISGYCTAGDSDGGTLYLTT